MPTDWKDAKRKVYIIPFDSSIQEGFPVKWYTIGKSFKVVVPDIYIKTDCYNDKVWENHRLNLVSV